MKKRFSLLFLVSLAASCNSLNSFNESGTFSETYNSQISESSIDFSSTSKLSSNSKTNITSSVMSSSSQNNSTQSNSDLNSSMQSSSYDEFVPEFSSSHDIYYWKNENNEYRFATHYSMNLGPVYSVVQEMQSLNNCSLNTMRTIIDDHYKGSSLRRNRIFELNYPINETGIMVFTFMDFSEFPSRNIAIYNSLGLLESYNFYYGESDQKYVDLSNAFSDDGGSILTIYSKRFTNLSHIYVWQDENNEYRCGVTPQKDNEPAPLNAIRYFQEYLPCSLSDMKRIVQAYYCISDVGIENLIIELPVSINTISAWREYVGDPYPNNVSSNRDLYEQLGILDSYNSNFEQ